MQYLPASDTFRVQGCFCSFACCKAHLLSSSSYDANTVSTSLTLFHKWTTGKIAHIQAAPPRHTLKMFGGELDIAAFRCPDAFPVVKLPRHMIVCSPNVVRLDAQITTGCQQPIAPHNVSFGDVATNNEPLRLKRSKPLKDSKNSLERMMKFG